MVKTPGICLGDADSTPALGISLFCAFNRDSASAVLFSPALGEPAISVSPSLDGRGGSEGGEGGLIAMEINW